jgi:hypothetical protein
MFRSELLRVQPTCLHKSILDRDTQTIPDLEELASCLSSLDCWEEFFDSPLKTGIFRATGNWQARLAAAAASVQQGKRTFVLPGKPCLVCLGGSDDIKGMDVIIS